MSGMRTRSAAGEVAVPAKVDPTAADIQKPQEKRITVPWDTEKPVINAHILLLLWSLAPMLLPVPTNVNIVVSASLTVYCGCFRSVKPTAPTETMTKGEAMRFPIVGSAVLFSLFLAFKFLPKAIVNGLLAAYFGIIAIVAGTATILPYIHQLFPMYIRNKKLVLPRFKIPGVIDNMDASLHPSLPELILGACASVFCAWYWMSKHWLANNSLGIMFSLQGIEQLSLGSVQTGGILLTGLFFYDIFWVFCTPVMVSVAKNFDAPIKLLFLRSGEMGLGGKQAFSMLGLGDIVIPGIFVALMLRHDVSRSFRSKYFQSAFGGYVLGLASTIAIMNYFQAAQPALLYIVPAMLGCVAIHAAVKGELLMLFHWSEAVEVPPAAVETGGKEEAAGSGASVTLDSKAVKKQL